MVLRFYFALFLTDNMIMSTNESQHELTTPLGNVGE